jgi:hypothetical protein
MIKVEWANQDKNVVRWQFLDHWTWQEFYQAQREVDAMIDTVEGMVDGIIFTSSLQHIPPNALTHLRKILRQKHQRYGISIVIGARSFLTALLNLLPRLIGVKAIYFVESEEAAYHHLAELREKRQETRAPATSQ